MARDSRILTVSYGAFSCRLEGFDDPLEAMRNVAEYFRDLAAEDRQFGLHPLPMADGVATQAPLSPDQATTDAPPSAPDLQETAAEHVTARLQRLRRELGASLLEGGEHEAPLAAPDFADAGNTPAQDDLAGTGLPVAALDPDVTALDGSDAAPGAEVDLITAPPDAALQPQAPGSADPVVEWDVEAAFPEPVKAIDAPETDTTAEDPDEAHPDGDVVESPTIWHEAPRPAAGEVTWTGASSDTGPAPDSAFPETLAEDDIIALADDASPVWAAPKGSAMQPSEDDDALSVALHDDAQDQGSEARPLADAAAETPSPLGKTTRSRRVTSRIVRIHPDDGDDLADDSPNTAPHTPEAELSRLMRQADDEMSDADNRRRLDSLAHLKAAVVATEAERAVTGEPIAQPAARADRYRDDLAQAVQPDAEEPTAENVPAPPDVDAESGTIRPGAFGPPPLVLVSEQRVDRLPPGPAAPPAPPPAARGGQPAPAPRTGRLTGMIGVGAALATPVSPDAKLVLPKPSHAVTIEPEEDEDLEEDLTDLDEAGLSGFARRLGASSMAELLEAAAAYATVIEKRSQFTRPQLMRRLTASAGGTVVGREDGLHSFGMLLRTGRIEKVGRGYYRLAKSSPYLAEARRTS